MAPEKSADLMVTENLKILGVSSLSEWDVLVFLYRHETSLTSAAEIAHLLGDSRPAVAGALDRLESLGLGQRSRGSQGVRLYRISISTDPLRYSSFTQLIRLAEKRDGRLLLLKHLPRRSRRSSISARGLHIA